MRVRYSPRARDDLKAILAYLSDRSPQGALSVKRSIKKTIELIGQYPNSGRLAGEGTARVLATGRHPYLVYWIIEAGEAWIVHIRDARRKPWRGE